MGEKSDAKLTLSLDGKSFKGIDAPTLEMTTLYDIQDDYMNSLLEEEFKINLGLLTFLQYHNKGLCFLKIIGVEPTDENIKKYSHILQKIALNNWLRRHGLPMRRRMR